ERGEAEARRYGLVSGFFRGIYNYDDRYLVTATVRADGVSTFRQGNKWGAFPSASAAWNIHNESFMEDNGIFDQLKLRVGYGTTVVAVDNKTVVGVKPSNTLGNPGLVWEKTQTANVGLDIALLNNRVNLTADFYNNESKNLLLEADIPTSTGYSKQYQNIATLRNRGVEFSLNTLNIRKENFQWRSAFNMTFNRSKVGQLFGSAGNDYMITNYESRINF